MPVARTHEKALVRQVDFDLIAAEPLPEFADVFTLDQHTVFGKAGGQIVVREAGQGELMAVQAAHFDMAFANGLEVEARDGVGRFVVAHAEKHAVDDLLEEIAGPHHGAFAGERSEALEPRGVIGGKFIGTAALFEDHRARGVVKPDTQFAGGKTADEIHEVPAVHPDEAGFLHIGGICAGELDVRIGRHDGQDFPFGLDPERTQISRPRSRGDDARRFLKAFDDVLFLYGKKHVEDPCCRLLRDAQCAYPD